MKKKADSRPAGGQADPSNYEDTLILFVIRLVQLQKKEYFKRYKPPEVQVKWNSDETVITNIEIVETEVDEERFVSYLSIVRQFWASSDELNVHKIKGILLYVARLLEDAAMRDRVKTFDREFRTRWNLITHSYCDSSGAELVALTQYELTNFWFNTVYFHSDPRSLDVAVPLLQSDVFSRWSRGQFEIYLRALVDHAFALCREAITILWKGVLPPGKLHGLLEMYVPLEIYAEERLRRVQRGDQV